MPRDFDLELDRFSEDEIDELLDQDDFGYPADFEPELAFEFEDDLDWLDDYNELFGDDFDEFDEI